MRIAPRSLARAVPLELDPGEAGAREIRSQHLDAAVITNPMVAHQRQVDPEPELLADVLRHALAVADGPRVVGESGRLAGASADQARVSYL
jgi:hypothetical protein